MPDLARLFRMQSEYQHKLRQITDDNRSDEMRKLCLALHAEVTDLSRCINIRPHGEDNTINRDRILYDAVDVVRYTIAILNNWGFDSEHFLKAYTEKDAYLQVSHKYDQNVYAGQPVVICDMDDVLTEFRDGYYKWVAETYGIKTDPNTTQYYMVDEFSEIGVNPEDAFRRFISEGGMYDLDAVPGSAMMIHKLVEAGFWVHILTARPDEDPACKYSTYMWLSEVGVPCHKLSFGPEKYRWLVQSGYGDRVVCAIDDSSKHVAEYVKHNIRVLCPRKTYNGDLGQHPLLTWYEKAEEVPGLIAEIAAAM
jgi:hypothetical protein